MKSENSVIKYYRHVGSRMGYSILLKGIKHFGYYPKGKEHISIKAAQELMDDQLGKILKLPKNSLVLDAGCGEGSVARYLAQHFSYRVEGIDLLDFNIKIANEEVKKEKLDAQVHYQIGDYNALPFPDNHFDGLYTMETLVHSPDYKKTLKEFHRVLKPGGTLVLFEYSMRPYDQLGRYEKYITDIINKGSSMPAFYHFTHGSFPDILTNAKFENLQIKDITQRMLELPKRFFHWAIIPFLVFSLLHVEKYFVNVTAGVVGYVALKRGLWKYNIIRATKPHAKS